MKGWLIGVLAIALLLSVLFPRQKEQPEDPRIAIWQAKYAEASSRAIVRVDTVRVRAMGLRGFRDTLRITDTVQVKLYLDRADSTVKACLDLANDCEAQKRAADFLIDAQAKENVRLRKKLERQSLTSRLGVFVGYGAVKLGDEVRAGWQIGVGLRVLP